MLNVAIIGLGARGAITYGDYLRTKEGVKICAICDIDGKKVEYYQKKYELEPKDCFTDDLEFLKEKRADLLLICSMDKEHYRQTMRALDLGYHIMLEKPIAATLKDSLDIVFRAEEKGKKVIVAHVLRYTKFYKTIKQIVSEGMIGDIMHIHQTENVGYWHQAHSFVRGNWHNSEQSTPMIVQKCCHDFDIIDWLMQKKCEKISSFGQLSYFIKQNKPVGATARCTDGCPYYDTCLFNSVNDYIKKKWWWQYSSLYGTDEDIMHSLETKNFGKCVFDCDNDVVDHQITCMRFENGATASLLMCAFSKECYRETKIMGTKGDIVSDDRSNLIHVNIFGSEDKVYDINAMTDDLSGHGGGDKVFMNEMIESLLNSHQEISSEAKNSIPSHIMAFAAEQARLQETVIDIKDFLKSIS